MSHIAVPRVPVYTTLLWCILPFLRKSLRLIGMFILFSKSIDSISDASLDFSFCESRHHRLAASYAVVNSSSILSISRTTFLLFSISLFFMYSSDKDVIASIALSMALSNLLHASSISPRLGNSCFSIKNSNLFREHVKFDLVQASSLFSDVSISALSFEIPVELVFSPWSFALTLFPDAIFICISGVFLENVYNLTLLPVCCDDFPDYGRQQNKWTPIVSPDILIYFSR